MFAVTFISEADVPLISDLYVDIGHNLTWQADLERIHTVNAFFTAELAAHSQADQ